MAPYGARLPFQLMLAPRVPAGALRGRRADRRRAAARRPAAASGASSGNVPPLNLWVRTAPLGADHFCWRIDVVPRLTHMAGLELGAGVHLNIVAPEQAAAELRERHECARWCSASARARGARRRRDGRRDRRRAARAARRHPRRRRGRLRPAGRQGPRAADLRRRRRPHERGRSASARCSSSASSRSTATRARATARPTSPPRAPEQAEPLYERFADRLGAAARRLRRDDGGRAGQRRPGDAPARACVAFRAPCHPKTASSPASPPSRRRTCCPTAAGPQTLHARSSSPPACASTATGEDLGEPGEIDLVPGPHLARAHVRARDRAHRHGLELFGYVSFAPGGDGEEPGDFHAVRRLHRARPPRPTPTGRSTSATRSSARGAASRARPPPMTLVWGRPLVDGGAVVTAELADLARRPVRAARGPLHAASRPTTTAATRSTSSVFDRRGGELAHESLYAEDDDEDDEDD